MGLSMAHSGGRAAGEACGLPGYREPLRIRPPRQGLRPGTAAGDPQVLW